MIVGARRETLDLGAIRVSSWSLGQGPTVLLLHGFPDTVATWRQIAPALADAGFRAVAITMRGYEPQAQPADADYSIAALAGDVHRTIEAIGDAPVHLVGHDWGASIAFAAAAGRPDLVRTLTALAVPHPAGFAAVVRKDFGQLLRSWYVYFFQLRGIADWLLARKDYSMLERLWRGWSPGGDDLQVEATAMRVAFREPGVLAAALAYYRTAFDTRHPRLAESLALLAPPIAAPTLGLAGVQDGCVRADVFEASMPQEWFPAGLRIQRVDRAGHFLHLERPDAIMPHLLAHLRGDRVAG